MSNLIDILFAQQHSIMSSVADFFVDDPSDAEVIHVASNQYHVGDKTPRPPSSARQTPRPGRHSSVSSHNAISMLPVSPRRPASAVRHTDTVSKRESIRARHAAAAIEAKGLDAIAVQDKLTQTTKELRKCEDERNGYKNKMQRLEALCRKKDKEIDEILVKGAQAAAGDAAVRYPLSPTSSFPLYFTLIVALFLCWQADSFLYLKSERSLTESLRQKTAFLEKQLSAKEEELATIKVSLKFTKFSETQSQLQIMTSEAKRLKSNLEQCEQRLHTQAEFLNSNNHQHSSGNVHAYDNPIYNVENWKLLHARVLALTKENETMAAQLNGSVEVRFAFFFFFF
jgi:hypothetical protein